MIEVIGAETFRKEIFDFMSDSEEWKIGDTPVILNFFATWCGPCHNFAPILHDVAVEYGNKIKVFKVDIDATPELPHLFGIRSVPTTVFLKKGEDPAMVAGGMGEAGLKKAIAELLRV